MTDDVAELRAFAAVRYRLRRLEEGTGRRLGRPADVAALVFALEAQSWSERNSST